MGVYYMSTLAPFTIIWTLINLILLGAVIYVVILVIKVLKIYIKKNQ